MILVTCSLMLWQEWRDFCIDDYRITFSIDDNGGVHFSIKRDDEYRGKT